MPNYYPPLAWKWPEFAHMEIALETMHAILHLDVSTKRHVFGIRQSQCQVTTHAKINCYHYYSFENTERLSNANVIDYESLTLTFGSDYSDSKVEAAFQCHNYQYQSLETDLRSLRLVADFFSAHSDACDRLRCLAITDNTVDSRVLHLTGEMTPYFTLFCHMQALFLFTKIYLEADFMMHVIQACPFLRVVEMPLRDEICETLLITQCLVNMERLVFDIDEWSHHKLAVIRMVLIGNRCLALGIKGVGLNAEALEIITTANRLLSLSIRIDHEIKPDTSTFHNTQIQSLTLEITHNYRYPYLPIDLRCVLAFFPNLQHLSVKYFHISFRNIHIESLVSYITESKTLREFRFDIDDVAGDTTYIMREILTAVQLSNICSLDMRVIPHVLVPDVVALISRQKVVFGTIHTCLPLDAAPIATAMQKSRQKWWRHHATLRHQAALCYAIHSDLIPDMIPVDLQILIYQFKLYGVDQALTVIANETITLQHCGNTIEI